MKIIDFNSKVDNLNDAKAIKEKVRIPLTPINIEAYLLYYLFDLLYPKFINDQQNVLDIIISDDGNDILKLYLYETKKAGIHESYQRLPLNVMKDKFLFQKVNLEKIDAFFNKLQLIIAEKKKVKISSVRIFKKGAIEIINEYCVNIEESSTRDFIRNMIELTQTIIEQDLFYMFPEPNILIFLKESMKFLKGIRFVDIFDFIDDLLPNFNIAVVFFSKKQTFILKLIKELNQYEKIDYIIEITTPEDLSLDLNDLTKEKIMSAVKESVNSDVVYLFNQDDLISLLLDIFELNVPLEKEKFQLIMQKILYGLRTYERNWYKIPRAKNTTLKRFFIKLLNVNLDAKKISHWAIPEIIMSLINSHFGLKSKILIIYTDIQNSNIINLNPEDYLDMAFRKGSLLEIENGSVINIVQIKKDLIISNDKINSIDAIKLRFTETQDHISAVISIDRSLLKKVINDFLTNFSKSKLLSKIKTLKMFKIQYNFNVYPELPLFKLLKESGSISLLKSLSSILVDMHEF